MQHLRRSIPALKRSLAFALLSLSSQFVGVVWVKLQYSYVFLMYSCSFLPVPSLSQSSASVPIHVPFIGFCRTLWPRAVVRGTGREPACCQALAGESWRVAVEARNCQPISQFPTKLDNSHSGFSPLHSLHLPKKHALYTFAYKGHAEQPVHVAILHCHKVVPMQPLTAGVRPKALMQYTHGAK